MGILKNLNYIQEATYYNCAKPDPVLVMLAAGDAIAPTLFSAVTFGCRDIVKMRAGISPWHSRGMKAFIEGAIPAEQHKTAQKLLKFTIPVEKALFFFFVVDLTTQFLANWQSNIFKLGACGEAASKCTWSGNNPGWASPGHGIASTVAYDTTEKSNHGCATFGFGFSVPSDWYWSCFFDITPRPIFNNQPVGQLEMWLQKRNPGTFNYPAQTFTPAWYSNQIAGSYYMNGKNKHTTYEEFWFYAASDVPAHAQSGSATFMASSAPLHEDSIIPVNCFGNPIPTARGPDF